jgi:hypothetical protein
LVLPAEVNYTPDPIDETEILGKDSEILRSCGSVKTLKVFVRCLFHFITKSNPPEMVEISLWQPDQEIRFIYCNLKICPKN